MMFRLVLIVDRYWLWGCLVDFLRFMVVSGLFLHFCHCLQHHRCYRSLVVKQQIHVLGCCVCCFMMFRMGFIVDRCCLWGFLVDLLRFMVVPGLFLHFRHCHGGSQWEWVHVWVFSSWQWPISVSARWLLEVSEFSVSLLAGVDREDTLVWFLVLVVPNNG